MENSNNKNTVRAVQNKSTSTVPGDKSTVKKESDKIVNIATRDKLSSQTEKTIKKETSKQPEKSKAEYIAPSNKEKTQIAASTVKKEQTAANAVKQGQALGNTVKKENISSATVKPVGKEKTPTAATAAGKGKTTTSALKKDNGSTGTTAPVKDKTPVSTSTAMGGKEKFSASTATLVKDKAPVGTSTATGGKEKFSASTTVLGKKNISDNISLNTATTLEKEKTSVTNASVEEKKEEPPANTINIPKKEPEMKEPPVKETNNEKEQEPEKAFKKDQTIQKSAREEQKLEKAKKAASARTAIKAASVAPSRAARSQSTSLEQMRVLVLNGLKILLPVAACIVVIVAIISFVGSGKKDEAAEVAAFNVEPLEENAHAEVNEMMQRFYAALADGDMDTVRALRDYNDDMDILTYEKKSEFIESYENVNCYTKQGIEENSYFTYVTYELKVKGDIETRAPGLNAFYVYTKADGSLVIDGRMEENIKAALRSVTSQDDVVDLYNKINVSYNDAIASDEALNNFLEELPQKITTSVGEALAQIEMQNNGSDNTPETMSVSETEVASASQEPAVEELQNQVVNQIVKTTDTVNVRSSDSEEADRIGKAQPGTELTRTEIRINGWSKVTFEGKDAYIKSDYLEVVSTQAENNTQTGANETVTPIGTVSAITNVNVRSKADQSSEKLGTAQAGDSFELLEEQGEWYKINYEGKTAYVKAEFFQK